jgi:iron(III) transport system substrate-binding protein
VEPKRSRWRGLIALLAAGLVLAAGCGGGTAETASEETTAVAGRPSAAPTSEEEAEAAPSGTISLYTSVTQDTVDAVLAALAETYPHIEVELFRAPTGELNARLASEERTGGIRADVIWHTDPLSMYAHDERDLLLAWEPEGAEEVPAAFRDERFWGARLLNLVIVQQPGLGVAGWADLTDEAHRDRVALPDPGFAGSAFAALGYFGLDPEFGLGYYRELQANGAAQVQSIDEVITGVAEGRFAAGIALSKSVQDAIDDGAPVELVWPQPGTITLYSPIAVFASTTEEAAAQAFVEFVLSEPGQEAIAGTGWQPVLEGVEGPAPPSGLDYVAQLSPDWEEAFGRQEELLTEYRTIFGG